MNAIRHTYLDSPVGRLLLVVGEAGLRAIEFERAGRPVAPPTSSRQDRGALARPIEQLEAYFAGRLRRFDLALELEGTEFQRSVWNELQRIAYGSTSSYADVARRIGRPQAVRAVGAANGRNPIPIVVPCHRVIGANGKLIGFGGGIPIKRTLLELEGAVPGTLL